MRYLAVVCCLAAPVLASDFVVLTEVTTSADDRSPASIVTIFSGQQIFEYAADKPDIVTVFDLESETIWSLDVSTKTRFQLPFRTLSRLVEEASLRAVRLSPTVRFAANPKYSGNQWDPNQQRLQLTHDLISYDAQLDLRVDPDHALRYRIYADWAARLNTISPGLPPGARLELNREIAMRDAVPLHVVCHRSLPEGERIQLTSSHQFRDGLSIEESQQIARFRQWLRDFDQQPWQR